jgi:Predicted transcriptional regulators
MTLSEILAQLQNRLNGLTGVEKIEAINQCKRALHAVSPFKHEPIDCVQWVGMEKVDANDYNPNHVAPPEKRLLYTSLLHNGFTQPIVAWKDGEEYTIVDGFHRHGLVKSRAQLKKRLKSYIPLVLINEEYSDKHHRIAATIQHNRARGQHQIQAMSDIVRELARLGWDDNKIASELGMDADEVLRLKQISGLMELFEDHTFSEAWTVK